MARLSAEALFLAGFTLAHAAWSVSDTAPDELLCPLAVLETGEERRLVRFEAETQDEAIRSMKHTMAEAMREGEAFAAAREGAWRPNDQDADPEDVLTVEFWVPGMDAPVLTLQRFQRAGATNAFALLGDPVFVLGGKMIRPEDASDARALLLAGVQSHPAVQPLWDGWH